MSAINHSSCVSVTSVTHHGMLKSLAQLHPISTYLKLTSDDR